MIWPLVAGLCVSNLVTFMAYRQLYDRYVVLEDHLKSMTKLFERLNREFNHVKSDYDFNEGISAEESAKN